ncbi:NAD-dependent epimerase/dehydratase family protein [Methanoculleus sp. FWC-SCC1]|uniref:NAD-dependent epimerase/dehydratase family protein n=1 Tax=Methanoculleus frigidifontis TaxID=2584085 RepID=A0ABT8M7P0_9EURY|nr:NAD-dependent epimerase/dehydratase family protein [Methanoculleus sp. FWC-SCC1]MDN7023945.1 NAD-dependent epimerase/dehydratase family protein [Methanoculleus sp. FWC-SCC1]
MSLKNRSVLVTGGAGFIGSHLVDALVREGPENLVVVDNLYLGKDENLREARESCPSLSIYHQDVADYDAMQAIIEKEGTDVVFNLAVIPLPASLEEPAWTFRHNNDMVTTICELARKDAFETLIHFSSSEAYGTSIYAPMDENHPLNATTPYAASKAAGDLLIFSYCRTFGLDAALVRPFNNYGPRQNERSYAGVIPLTIKRILNGEAPVIHGDGRQTRDYLYVTDTARAAIDVYNTSATRNRVLNIASGKEVSIEHIIRFIARYMGCEKNIVYQPERPGDVRRHIANVFLAEDLIGFSPQVSFDDGLAQTIEWYRQHLALR